jgi:peroxiredoxin
MRLALALFVSLGIVAAPAHALAGGESAGDFTLPSLSGENVSLSDYLGKKVILVSFFATWCAPCIKEMRKLDTMQKELADRGLQVISISVDEARDKAKVKALIKRMRYSPPVLLDADSKVINTYNPRKDMPWTMIIGMDKQIHHKKKGFTDGDEEKLRKWIEALLPAAG